MATWNADKPAIGNTIAADIPDIEENFQELHDVVETITSGTLGTTEPAAFTLNFATANGVTGYCDRAIFSWKDADEIYISAGAYYHAGTTNQIVYWDSKLTFQLQSGGSNAASDDYGADGWHYIYLDDSAIVTKGTALLDNTCFLNDTTAPSWSETKHGWYNGNDRCIFAVYETGDAIVEFFHDNEVVIFSNYCNTLAQTDIDTTWTDVTLRIPGFSTKALAIFTSVYGDGSASSFYRTNGQTGATGHLTGSVAVASTISVNTIPVITDSSQKIEIKHSASTSSTSGVDTAGWYFPIGM